MLLVPARDDGEVSARFYRSLALRQRLSIARLMMRGIPAATAITVRRLRCS